MPIIGFYHHEAATTDAKPVGTTSQAPGLSEMTKSALSFPPGGEPLQGEGKEELQQSLVLFRPPQVKPKACFCGSRLDMFIDHSAADDGARHPARKPRFVERRVLALRLEVGGIQ